MEKEATIKKPEDILSNIENDIYDVMAVVSAGREFAQYHADKTGGRENGLSREETVEINGIFDYIERLFGVVHEKLEAVQDKLDDPVLDNIDDKK